MPRALCNIALHALFLAAVTVPVLPTRSASAHAAGAKVQTVKVSVTTAGFVPASIRVRRDAPIRLLITRRTDHTCATQAVFPSIDQKIDLPLNKTVSIMLPAQASGRLGFACGMGMVKGEIVVR